MVVVNRDIAIDRLQKRNNFSYQECEKRLDSQWSNEKRESFADVVIHNNGTREELEATVLKFLHFLVCFKFKSLQSILDG